MTDLVFVVPSRRHEIRKASYRIALGRAWQSDVWQVVRVDAPAMALIIGRDSSPMDLDKIFHKQSLTSVDDGTPAVSCRSSNHLVSMSLITEAVSLRV